MSIKDLFPGYLGLDIDDIESIWKDAVIFLDANVILNLYEYSKDTYEEFLKVLKDGELEERIYITYQVGFEYSRNRRNRISRQAQARRDIEEKISKTVNTFKDWVTQNYKNHSVIDIKN